MENVDLPHADLLRDIETFIEAHDMTKSAFGVAAVRDPRFVFDLEGGRECRRSTVIRVRRFMGVAPSATPAPTSEAAQ